MSDHYGRSRLLRISIIIFVAASLGAGLSQTMTQLIGSRAVQGLGAGGITAMTMTIVGDIVSPRERGRYQGFMVSMFAVANIAGPLVGGFFVDRLSWRWAFFINIPIGLAALVVVTMVLDLPFRREASRVDYAGASLLMGASISLLLVAVWGGNEYRWTSPVILSLIGTALVLGGAFALQERRADPPILPLHLFGNPVFAVASVAGLLVALIMFVAVVFLPVFLQIVEGVSATRSGLLMLPLMGAMVVSAFISGQLVSRTGRYKIFSIIGAMLMVAGLVFLSRIDADVSRTSILVGMVLLGLGVGQILPVLITAVQNAVAQQDMAVATSTYAFARSLGGTYGIAVFGGLLNSRLAFWLGELVPDTDILALGLDPARLLGSPEQMRALPGPILDGVVEAFGRSIDAVFTWAIPVSIAALVVMIFLKELPLRKTAYLTSDTEGESASQAGTADR